MDGVRSDMFHLKNFLQRAGRPGPELQPHRFDEQERIARLVSERLAEDERLRGDLTDAGFGPVLTLVTSMVPAAAARATADPHIDNAEETVSHGARALTKAIVQAASTGDVGALSELLSEPMLSDAAAERARAALAAEPQLPEIADERAIRIAEIVRAAIQEER